MDFEEKLKEFYECNIYDKYSVKSATKFSDGSRMGYWFSKKEVRDMIFSSSDKMCVEIKEAYYLYKREFKRIANKELIDSIYLTETKNRLYEEFLNCEDMNKFAWRSDVLFSNGTSMSKWFSENQMFVLASKNVFCVEITNQYEQYLKNEKETYIKKQKILYSKHKQLFYREKNMSKFDISSNVKFPDGTFMGEWFAKYKEHILSSDSPIEKAIKDKYELYLSLYELKKEFLEEENLEKFDIYGYVKFSTGALMNLYWEIYQNDILSSTCNIDRLIKKQYEEYQRMTNTDINYLDSEENVLENKKQKKA